MTDLVATGKTIFGNNNNPIISGVEKMVQGIETNLIASSKSLIDAITNNTKAYNDNRTIAINNPKFDSSGTYDQFVTFLNKAFTELDQNTKIGK